MRPHNEGDPAVWPSVGATRYRPEVGVSNEDKVQVVVRLDRALVKAIDHLAVDAEMYRQDMVEQLLREALRTREQQLELYERSTVGTA